MPTTTPKQAVRGATPREAAELLDVSLNSINKAITQQVVLVKRCGPTRTRWLDERELAALAVLKDVDLGLPLTAKRRLTGWVRTDRPYQQPGPAEFVLQGGLTVRCEPAVKHFIARVTAYLELRDQWIRIDPDIKGGSPTIAGTRISVHGIAARIASGDTFDMLCEDYPTIPRDAFETAVAYARSHPRRGRPRSDRPWDAPGG